MIKQNKMCGFTLVETAIVLAVVGLILGGIWIGAANIQNNIKKNKLNEQILRIAQNTRNHFVNQPSTEKLGRGDDPRYAIQAGLIPDDMIKAGNNILHAFSGRLFIAADDNQDGIANAGFRITMENVSTEAVNDLIFSKLAPTDTAADKIGLYQGCLKRNNCMNMDELKKQIAEDYAGAAEVPEFELRFNAN